MYFRTTVSNETAFKDDIKPNLILKKGKPSSKEHHVIPKEDVMYTCRVILQIQSIFSKGSI